VIRASGPFDAQRAAIESAREIAQNNRSEAIVEILRETKRGLPDYFRALTKISRLSARQKSR